MSIAWWRFPTGDILKPGGDPGTACGGQKRGELSQQVLKQIIHDTAKIRPCHGVDTTTSPHSTIPI
jgi:hypothetical protein